MKKIILFLFLFIALVDTVSAQAVLPSYDKAKHYQLRSMETGPWEFHPPGWYYSWWSKDGKILWWDVKWRLPGLGIHDNGPAGIGGGDKYVTRFSPNRTQRAIMLVQAKQSKAKYENITASISEIHKRELLEVSDRTIDIVYSDYENIFLKLNTLMFKKIIEYKRMIGLDDQLRSIILEHNKIKESISYTRKSYVRNIDKKRVYLSELKKLEQLIIKCNRILSAHYSFITLEDLEYNV